MRNNERGKELRELRTRVIGKRLELEERVLEELNTKFPLCCNCTNEKPLPETRTRSESLRTSIAVASTKWTDLVLPGCSIYLVAATMQGGLGACEAIDGQTLELALGNATR